METIEDHSVLSANVDSVKTNDTEEVNEKNTESPECHKSNGIDCDETPESDCSENIKENSENNTYDSVDAVLENNEILIEHGVTEVSSECITPVDTDVTKVDVLKEAKNDSEIEIKKSEANENSTQSIDIEKESCSDHEVIAETIEIDTVESIESAMSIEQVAFETEILVEKNDTDNHENVIIEEQINDSNNILSELGPNIELSEVLQASDVSENNNSTVKQEIFNKEELLDILEGNDEGNEHIVEVEQVVEVSEVNQTKLSDTEIALQQLSRLKGIKKKKYYTSKGKKSDKKANPDQIKCESHIVSENNIVDINKDELVSNNIEESIHDTKLKDISDKKQDSPKNNMQQRQRSDSIVTKLVMDWEDDEPGDNKRIEKFNSEPDQDSKDPETITDIHQNTLNVEPGENTSIDSASGEEQSQKANKSGDESAPRRLSRVIKKKVIFDPDNPDTFTKGKTTNKVKDISINKEQTPLKKIKPDHITPRSKSPLSKLQWKKPTPKQNKQNKRLTEVDKLLMDEGAVNMIYQLTPEAPKGKKNMKTKAEFIKKIQSSTPDGKEMKFRERKKESMKYEDGDPKKILSGKQRISLSSSVKSPSVSEDFETHSADDSIIYRRHSSSSYSSSCMSPRRLSDVESGSGQNINKSAQPISSDNQTDSKTSSVDTGEHSIKSVFKTEIVNTNDIINKDDCLSIKQKLNSKLSIALNKRKRETTKSDKPPKQKKILKTHENAPVLVHVEQFKFISVNIDQRLAVINIQKKSLKICVEVLKELEEALNYVDNRDDISATLFSSQCGTLCSSLDLSLLLHENKETRNNHAYELAESVRALLSSVVRHSKLVCAAAGGVCAGVALALVALSDVPLACEGATFSLAATSAPPLPGASALTARCALPQPLVNDLVVFGRRLSAAEALRGGLVSRVLWPDRFDEQVHDIARDIASQPPGIILLKKKLLSLKQNSEMEQTFLSSLETERDLLVEYWTSVEGQELLRATLDAA